MRLGGCALLLALCAGCAAQLRLSPGVQQALDADPDAYVAGEVLGLGSEAVLEDRDFAYAAELAPDSGRAAWVHLGADGFRLALSPFPPQEDGREDVLLNPVENDVEAMAFTPDGRWVITAGRDGALRLLEAASGAPAAVGMAESPLVSVAVHPSGTWVAAGGADGRVGFHLLPGLEPAGAIALHRDEVRGLAFTSEGRLVSGSWDRSVALTRAELGRARITRTQVQVVRPDGLVLLRPAVNDRATLGLVVDARAPAIVLTAQAAQAAGIDTGALTESLKVPTAMGVSRAPLARDVLLRFRELPLRADVAVCDACVPAGAAGVLGAPFDRAISVTFIGETQAELSLRDPTIAPELPLVEAKLERRHTLSAHVNALGLDAQGTRLAVALSETPAKRTREVYQREKAGTVEPLARDNAAVVLELESGRELARQSGHHGVVSAVALSPDGATLASGGWDRMLRVLSVGTGETRGEWRAGWSVRMLRFARDGRRLIAAAWTPINATGDQRSEPAVNVFALQYAEPRVESRPAQPGTGTTAGAGTMH